MTEMINQEQFENVIAGEERVVVKISADWCPDCKRMDFFIGSVLEDLESFPFYELNKDEYPEVAEKYDVMGIPSLLVFQNGEKIGHLHSANAKTPDEVSEFLSQYFNAVSA
ncbi:thioredoxin-like negative regulator of GroEL [Alkalibacillus flavidus]|uniref:Thioredoxin-like negative regulator of GroEL n=1 Tax=Alkalibacillus flavidus TaxID=546021 RepID=A0ABV2KTK6_9BACI